MSLVYPKIAGTESGVIKLAALGSPITAPTDTAENTVFTYTLPGGAMGIDGVIEVSALLSCVNNANAKTVRIKLGATTFHTMALAGKLSGGFDRRIYSAGSESAQRSAASTLSHDGGTSGVAVTSSAVDTSVDTEITITVQKATGSDSVILEGVVVRLIK